MIDHHISGKNLNMSVLNMLNTRYFILQGKDGKPTVQRNPDAMGNGWFVDSVLWVTTPDEEIAALRDIDVVRVAAVDTVWRRSLGSIADAVVNSDTATRTITLTDYTPGALRYRSVNAQAQLAVFSEVYYKTWKAYVDGEEAPLLRANYILRALAVPAGEHTIELRCYDALAVRCAAFSGWGSGIVGVIIAAMCIVLIINELRKRKKE
jgi:hypothetical protein